ncbi:kinesin-like protein KIFC2 isoform X4 [Zalophus californianus]|uniref:Kinesin-like protein n=1 Tax=Zalophus californianus TaxID=9704 RepID=A0A6J2DLC7_ZALCA|nr:kinesin-like protein KIFC2 isoform X4 [Zalophus californianus]
MYAFYSLLIYIFYSLFRRDGGAAAAGDPGDPAQSAGCQRGGRRRPDQPPAELWTELTGLVGLTGCSESEDGPEEGAEGRPTEVSLEEALVRLAEFLSVQLGAEESLGNPPDLTKPSDVPPLLTVTGQLLALLAWIRSPRGRQALSQGTQPASEGQCPTPAGSPSQEESPSLSPRDEAQGQNLPQLEEDQRAWQRLEQLILGQLEELKQQLELQEEELGRLRLGVGATDSEKRVQHLTLENEALKQSLSLTRDLLLHWGPGPSTRAPQEEAEALAELQSRLQEAQDTTEALQVQVFRELEPAVLSCLRGYSVCIFTYGQTGTGKTYSMEGPPEDPGIAPRALQSLFQEMGTGGQHRVTLSMVEIYNEAVRDLLAPGPPERLAVRQGPAGQGGIQVAGLTYWDVPNLETLHQMLSLGRSNRATAATTKNRHSSRSHALVTLTLRTASPPRGPGTAGTLHLVDLAGSERAWKAGAASTSPGDRDGAQRLREARTINRSLLALGGVMAALRARRPHVPFRDSQLTRLLQPALGPGATAVLLLQGPPICAASPQISTRPEDLGETVCSLKFAERVGQVELGPARRCRAPRSGTPSSLSTDTPLTGTPCTPTPSPGSPPSPGPESDSSSALGTQKNMPS